MPRVFFGLEIPPAIKDRLLTVRAEVPGAQWQGAEQLHITLLFLGNVEPERLAAVCEAASDLAFEAFPLQLTGLGCFGQPHRPRNLWAGVQPVAPVARLHQALQERMKALGLATENRGFRPHLTLARFKSGAGSVEPLLAEYGERVFGQFPVTELTLFESKPGPAGSRYTIIQRLPGQ